MKEELVSKDEQTTLLDYRDEDSITASVENYLNIIKLVGKQNAQGNKLYQTKQCTKSQKLIREIFHYFGDKVYSLEKTSIGYECISKNLSSDDERHFYAMFEKLKRLIKQQFEIINAATQIYAEGYDRCSDEQLDCLFGTYNMIKDVIKTVDVLESVYRAKLHKIRLQHRQVA